MKLAKDLLYDKQNEHLDIARFSALLSVIGYSGLSAYYVIQGGIFDFLQWGTGWAAICGGNAAWIFARQRYEAGISYTHSSGENGRETFSYGSPEYRSPRTNDYQNSDIP